jgi:hypothetical protein
LKSLEKMKLSNVKDNNFEKCPPKADAMINSLRAFGYDLSMAIADLIDNSIYASARNIWIRYGWNEGNPWITILDDGVGMTENTLKEAMRLGSQNPDEERSPGDLGRFGLGLKTATFSQCKLLTVCSKTAEGEKSVRYWDLDHVQEVKEWEVGTEVKPETFSLISPLEKLAHGTIIVWQNLDRIIDPTTVSSEKAEARFYGKFVSVAFYLEMIFHRYLSGGKTSIAINVGMHKCKPWDPYLKDNDFTQELSSERYEDGRISVVPYVLPHVSKRSAEETGRGAGPRGWNAQQGFYVYRNKRMIISGGYLDFDIKPEEHFKLGRIQLDITNDMDHEWNIDVRKAFASPPDRLRSDLLRVAKATRNEAVKIYRARTGRPRNVTHINRTSDIWLKKRIGEKIVYRINKNNSLLKILLNEIDPPKHWAERLFHVIEATIPHRLIIIDNAESEDCHVNLPIDKTIPPASMLKLCEMFYLEELKNDKSHQEAVEFVTVIEPFDSHPAYRAHLDSLIEEGK